MTIRLLTLYAEHAPACPDPRACEVHLHARRNALLDTLGTAHTIAGLVLEAAPPGLPVGHLPLTFGGVPERMVDAGLLHKTEVDRAWYLTPAAVTA